MEVVLKFLSQTLKWVVAFLPNSPFQALSNSVIADYLSALNWIFPFSYIVSVMELWLSAIAVYYLYLVILRWVKAVQ